MLEGTILKASMVLPGKDSGEEASIEEVAEATLMCLKSTVPAILPGIVFLSGGQSDEDATAHLDAMNRMGPNPWPLSFSYGRAMQSAALKLWSKDLAATSARRRKPCTRVPRTTAWRRWGSGTRRPDEAHPVRLRTGSKRGSRSAGASRRFRVRALRAGPRADRAAKEYGSPRLDDEPGGSMRIGLALVFALLATGCAQLPARPDLPEQYALAPAATGPFAELLGPAEASHPGQSGFRLVGNGIEALALRAHSARQATHSLDVQTYIWHDDLTGRLLAARALEAADRGVRVRLLIDDLDARAKNHRLAALDAHPRIEVRLFNPFASRSGTLSKATEMGAGFKRLNHRMHNKSWIVDNRAALVGGRNLGDEYFDASSEAANFIDLDFLMAGPVVAQVSHNFDRYWNSPAVYPIALLSPKETTPEALERLRPRLEASLQEAVQSQYARVVAGDEDVQRMLAQEGTLRWTPNWRFASDPPAKALGEASAEGSSVVAALLPVLQGARERIGLISPYFVPGRNGTATLVGRARDGIEVMVLTNSLAATDVAAVHGGYARYRVPLLEGGVSLWELKPQGTQSARFSLGGSSGSSLHTKAMVIDDDWLFVGSYNIDPRSTMLNCEQGVLVRDAALTAELATLYAAQLHGDKAWRVQLVDGDLRWSDGTSTFERDPGASAGRRFQAWLMRLLPVESQL